MMEFCAGYLVLPDFATSEQVEAMKARALELIEQFEVDKPSIFSTVNQVRRVDVYVAFGNTTAEPACCPPCVSAQPEQGWPPACMAWHRALSNATPISCALIAAIHHRQPVSGLCQRHKHILGGEGERAKPLQFIHACHICLSYHACDKCQLSFGDRGEHLLTWRVPFAQALGPDGKLQVPKSQAANKIGKGPSFFICILSNLPAS